MKKREGKGIALLVSAIIVIAVTSSVAVATDWAQFQEDEINSGWTTDCAPVNDPPTLVWYNDTHGQSMGGIDVTPIVGDGDVYVLDYKGYLWSFDAITGVENWPVPTKCNVADGVFEVSTPAYDDGIVYVAASSGSAGNGAGRINAVYANDGTIRESCYYGLSGFQINTPVRYADGKVYFGNWKGGHTHTEDNGTYYCVDADNVCNLIWSRTADYVTGYYWAGAAIVDNYPGVVDGYIIYGDDRANVTCLNKDTGEFVDYINVSEQCGITTVEEIRSSIVWNEDTGRIYFTGKSPQSPASGHAYAVAFNSLTGDLGGDGAVGGGSCEWNNSIGYSTSTPVVYNDRVYVGAGGMYGGGYGLKCLNEADGTLRYETSGIGAVQASPAVSAFGGDVYIYFTTNVLQGKAYCFEDTDSGLVERWGWLPPNYQHILQGVAISKGMVYFGNDAGYVYALAGDCGDVNYDGLVHMGDALAVRNHWGFSFSLCSPWAGDVNCDELIHMGDALAIRNHWGFGFPLGECCKDCC